jgi:hypothetical protein
VSALPEEPRITISGVRLTEGQAMTLRVALESFAVDVASGGLGGGRHGRAMARGYAKRIDEIRRLMFAPPTQEGGGE